MRALKAATTAGAAAAAACLLLTSIPSASAAGSGDWLTEVNLYRQATGLPVVTEQTSWTVGLKHHFTYLVNTPASYRTGQYANAHTENPNSPWYTADEAQEAGSRDLYECVPPLPVGFIDGWPGG